MFARTPVPLDVLVLDVPAFRAGLLALPPARWVLEVAAGWTLAHGVTIGTPATLHGVPDAE